MEAPPSLLPLLDTLVKPANPLSISTRDCQWHCPFILPIPTLVRQMASRRQPHSQKIGLQKAGSDSDDSDPDENDKDGLDLMMILRRPLPQGKRRLTSS